MQILNNYISTMSFYDLIGNFKMEDCIEYLKRKTIFFRGPILLIMFSEIWIYIKIHRLLDS